MADYEWVVGRDRDDWGKQPFGSIGRTIYQQLASPLFEDPFMERQIERCMQGQYTLTRVCGEGKLIVEPRSDPVSAVLKWGGEIYVVLYRVRKGSYGNRGPRKSTNHKVQGWM